MTRINLLLLLLVMASGLVLVHSAYEARRLFTELDRAKTEGSRLAADAERLAAERHIQSTNIRVEQVAREKLQMRLISPAVVQAASRPASGASQ
jgi:cell division protein FtsL